MYCPNCGVKNDDGDLFCASCGTPLREVEVPVEPEFQGYEPEGAQPEGAAQQNQPFENLQGQPAGENPHWQEQQTFGQNAWSGQPAGNTAAAAQGQPVQRKPLPKLMFVVIAEAVAAAALIAGIFMVAKNRFSPETVARNYWEAVMDHEWGKAYDYCSFPDSELLSRQMYVNANAYNDEIADYESVRVIDSMAEAQSQLDSMSSWLGDYAEEAQEMTGGDSMKNYTIEYRLKGSSENCYSYVTVAKTDKKKFLFWDDWKVTSSDSWAQDVQVMIPENAKMTLNGVEVDTADAAVEDGMKTVTIPYLFTGQYQMSVTEEGMMDYNRLLTVSSYGIDESYISLIPSEETVNEVAAKAGEDIKTIVESALEGKPFSDVADLFTEDTLNDGGVENDYENLVEELAGDGETSGVISLQLNNFNVELASQPGSGNVELYVTIDKKETYRRFWSDDPGEDNYEMSKYVAYQKDGDEWKLIYLPVASYDF